MAIKKCTVEEAMIKWKDKKVDVKIKGIVTSKKFDKRKGWLVLIALEIESTEILELREDLNVEKQPKKLTLHITLLEKPLRSLY